MKKDEIIQNAVKNLLDAFKAGALPEAVAFTIIRRKEGDERPCDSWSIGNRILMSLQGSTDARGYKQWTTVGRQVQKGSKAIHILAPMTRKIKENDPKTGEEEEKVIITGFRPIPVFRVEDTDGLPLPTFDYKPSKKPTFFDVAEKMGIPVRYVPKRSNYLGVFHLGTNSIDLCSEDAVVYYHELSHAIHSTFVDLKSYDSANAEVVAEFSALVMASIAGIKGYENQGFAYIEHYAKTNKPEAVMKMIFKVLNDVERIVQIVLDVSNDAPAERLAV